MNNEYFCFILLALASINNHIRLGKYGMTQEAELLPHKDSDS